MSISIRTLPILERWDCHGCSRCCRDMVVSLDEDDLRKLAEQKWDEHPDFRHVRTVARASPFGGRRVLAKKADGSCVFLSEAGRCRIHEAFGPEAKPAICRMFPLQLVPLDKFGYLTPRRSCPSAAAELGRPVQEHVAEVKQSGLLDRFAPESTRPPAIARGARLGWPEFLAAAGAVEHLLTDERFPLVRRIIHGLAFCELLEKCKLRRVDERAFSELMQLLKAGSREDAGDFFRDRQAPSRSTGVLFRQLGVHYVRAFPGYPMAGGWGKRWRLLGVSAKFARGKGDVPAMHPEFPSSSFEDLERPLGPLDESVARPMQRFFESHAISKQFAIVAPRQTFVESFRTLAFLYPMGLWLLRLASAQRQPTSEDMVRVVVALDRGQGLAGLKRAVTTMAETQQLQRLIAWYAR